MTSFSILLPFLFFFFFFSSLTTAWVSFSFPLYLSPFCRLQYSEYTLTHAHKRIDMRQNSRRRWSLYSWGRGSDGSTGRTITFVFSGMYTLYSSSSFSFFFLFLLPFFFYFLLFSFVFFCFLSSILHFWTGTNLCIE